MANKHYLKHELYMAGARKDEVFALLEMVKKINQFSSLPPQLSKQQKKRILSNTTKRSFLSHSWLFKLSFALGMFAVVASPVTIIKAQSSHSNDNLYGIKLFSQSVRLFVQPGYIKTVAEDRQKNVEHLIKTSADPYDIQKAEKSFEETVKKAKESGYPVDYITKPGELTEVEKKLIEQKNETESLKRENDNNQTIENKTKLDQILNQEIKIEPQNKETLETY